MFQLQTIQEKIVIPRYDGWEEIFEPLVRKITGVRQGKVTTGVDYDNKTFRMKTHRFGMCNCLYGKAYREFEKDNKHSLECFHTGWLEIQEAFKKHPQYHEALILKTERINMERQLCHKYNVRYKGGNELEKVCTCNFTPKWKELGITHDEDCDHIAPNFWHKESDFKIWWDKKYFKDAYCNQQIDLNEFKKMIRYCSKSV